MLPISLLRVASDAPSCQGKTTLAFQGCCTRAAHGDGAQSQVAVIAQRLRDEYRVDTLVLLNEDHEIARFVDDVAPPAGPQDLRAALRESDIELLRFPIPDGGTPHPGHDAELRVLLGEVVDQLRAGRTVAVACRGGIGRTGTILGLLLIELGCTPAEAVQRVREMKRECIDRGRQEEFVRAWKPTPGVS